MKVAIVHDYLHEFGGGEKVVEKWLQLYPQADLYTAFFIRGKFKDSEGFANLKDRKKRVFTTFVQKIMTKSWGKKFFKHLFWLYPLAMKTLKVKGYDLVLISSVYCAKNPKFINNKKIIHYCHSPTRFLHGLTTEIDHKKLSFIWRVLIPIFKFPLKRIDLKAVKRLNKQNAVWLANSKFIKQKIREIYKTDSEVVYPPIELKKFLKIKRKRSDQQEDYYLCHGRISHHKRIDLAVHACIKMGKKLKVSGSFTSPVEEKSIKQIVEKYEKENPTNKGLVEFLGRTTDEQYYQMLSECRAFLFPGEEDFGIAPVEVLAAGVPVIAYRSGGALEYIEDGVNGVFFKKQQIGYLANAIQEFEAVEGWSPTKIRETVLDFDEKNFNKKIKRIVARKF